MRRHSILNPFMEQAKNSEEEKDRGFFTRAGAGKGRAWFAAPSVCNTGRYLNRQICALFGICIAFRPVYRDRVGAYRACGGRSKRDGISECSRRDGRFVSNRPDILILAIS